MENADFFKKLDHDIATYGLQVLHVFGDETGPGFSYSIGLYKTYEHPEIIMIGLSQDLMHSLINSMASEIKKGKVYTAFQFDDDILENFDCYITEVSKDNYYPYVVQASNYYGNDDFPLVQCIYPTTKGIYPWDERWPNEIKDLQPILGPIPNQTPNQL